jgi:hypothetical protein
LRRLLRQAFARLPVGVAVEVVGVARIGVEDLLCLLPGADSTQSF